MATSGSGWEVDTLCMKFTVDEVIKCQELIKAHCHSGHHASRRVRVRHPSGG